MSSDEAFICKVVQRLLAAGIDHVLIGCAAAALQGVPVATQDVDIFVRDTELTRRKIRNFAALMGGLALTSPGEPLSRMVRAIGADTPIDFVFSLSSRRSFESVRSRSISVSVGQTKVRVACLKDILDAKEAAGRQKDKLALDLIRKTLRVKKRMGSEKNRRKGS